MNIEKHIYFLPMKKAIYGYIVLWMTVILLYTGGSPMVSGTDGDHLGGSGRLLEWDGEHGRGYPGH